MSEPDTLGTKLAGEVDTTLHHRFQGICSRCGLPLDAVVHRRESEPDTLDTAAIRANLDLFGPGHRVVKDLCDEVDRLRAVVAELTAERDAARWYRGMLENPNVLVQRDLALSCIRDIEDQMLDDPEAHGHGLFCHAHYPDRGRPCDCWAAKLAEIVEIYHRAAIGSKRSTP